MVIGSLLLLQLKSYSHLWGERGGGDARDHNPYKRALFWKLKLLSTESSLTAIEIPQNQEKCKFWGRLKRKFKSL